MNDTLIDNMVARAVALHPGESLEIPGLHVNGVIVARSKTGRLRYGDRHPGRQKPCWRQGDGEALFRESLEQSLDWRSLGYFADANRRRIEMALRLVAT